MTECRQRLSSQAEDDSSSRSSPIQDYSTKKIMNIFRRKLQQDIHKLINYDTNKIKWVNEKPSKERKAYQPTEVSRRFDAFHLIVSARYITLMLSIFFTLCSMISTDVAQHNFHSSTDERQ